MEWKGALCWKFASAVLLRGIARAKVGANAARWALKQDDNLDEVGEPKPVCSSRNLANLAASAV